MKFRTLTLPVKTLAAIASMKDDTLREQFLNVLETGTANPDTFNPDDYLDANPVVAELARRIGRRAASARRLARNRAGKIARQKTGKSKPRKSKKRSNFAYIPLKNIFSFHLTRENHELLFWLNRNYYMFVGGVNHVLNAIVNKSPYFKQLQNSFNRITCQVRRFVDSMVASLMISECNGEFKLPVIIRLSLDKLYSITGRKASKRSLLINRHSFSGNT